MAYVKPGYWKAGYAVGDVFSASVQIAATTDDAAFSGGAVVAGSPASVYVGIGATTSDAVFSGSAYVSPSFRISATTDSAVFSGGATVGTFSGSISDADIARIADAVMARLLGGYLPVNVKKVNDLTIVGQGLAPPNHWRPA